MNQIAWRGMTRAQLDTAYDNSAAFPDSARLVTQWAERSAQLRARDNAALDLAYAPGPRNRIDIFRSGKSRAPLFVFIHGGYWQRNSKEAFSCVAEGPLAHDMDVALIGYTLAPEVTLSTIVEEVRAALAWLRAEGPRHGIAQGGLIVSGWSAGGHLTAAALAEADAGLPISGVYDIEPCRLNYLNEKLRLSEQETLALSPLHHLKREKPKPVIVAFGSNELPELQRQSRDYHRARTEAGLPSELLALSGHDHYTILEELISPTGKLTEAATRLAAAL